MYFKARIKILTFTITLNAGKVETYIKECSMNSLFSDSSVTFDYNGAALLTRIMKSLCRRNLRSKSNFMRCKYFRAIAPAYFHRVEPVNLNQLFDEAASTDDDSMNDDITQATGVNTWNIKSIDTSMNSPQLIARFARNSCPVTFFMAPHLF